MIELKQSQVRFDEDSHRYYRDDKELSGITGLIHSVLRLGVYPTADQFAQEVRIPLAGHYGKCVHRAIETYERNGLDMTRFPVEVHDTEHYGLVTFPAHDVCEELEGYKALKGSFDCIGVEFLVDYGDYASCIDCVWTDEQGRIYLVDHKTNNLDSYPGGAVGLKEYLSWQLSCYAVMFERQTGLKVAGLLANWIRHGERRQWDIERQPDEQVLNLLGTVVLRNPVGGWLYINEAMQRKDDVPVAATQADLAVPQEVTTAIADLLRAEKAAKAMKEKLRELMEQNGVSKWECDEFTATIGKPSETTTFDSKALKATEPEIYDRFTKQVSKKGNFTLKLKY
jgi:hypothetical protein